MDLTELRPLLEKFISSKYGAGASLTDLQVMEAGHAGLTNGFKVVDDQRRVIDNLIMKMAPRGVKRSGNTDIYRQAQLLRALHGAGMPVPEIRWDSNGESEFGVPYIMMERIEGREFYIWEPHESFGQSADSLRSIWQQTVELLASLHSVDWQETLADWEEPRQLREEVLFWNKMLRQSPQSDWVAQGEGVELLLLEQLPSGAPVGLLHGDFQPGNLLFNDGEAQAIVDWDLAGIGSQLVDVGWLMMCSDPKVWHTDYRPSSVFSPQEVQRIYEQCRAQESLDLYWYHAFACYRMGAISCQNVKLHRKGQRRDPVWEQIALSVPLMFARAEAILERD
jgi:aminoglycoside phosphotransferase (APT) family kinase protein